MARLGLTLLNPSVISANPENPRLIFRQDDLVSLQESISQQGILVPLTVFPERKGYVLLDGERRWRCATKLGFDKVPVIVQPKPDRLQNIMMMFAIHNARRDWDPLPTAYKLRDLETMLEGRDGKRPTERALAELASISTGEVRRLKKLLNLPEAYRNELMKELEKPRPEQSLSVDQVLEAIKGAEALRKRDIVSSEDEDNVRRAIIDKFKRRVIVNTVAPRKLARVARAVQRKELSKSDAQRVVRRLIDDPTYTIDNAFADSVAQVDFEHGTEQLAKRLRAAIDEHVAKRYAVSPKLRKVLTDLIVALENLLKR
jgi:ParB/RepB/Spo0J family partition protein